MKTETETGVMLSQTKEYLRLLEAEETRKDPLLEAVEGVWSCQHLDFRLEATKYKWITIPTCKTNIHEHILI